MSTDAKTSVFKKDKNNNLSYNQCEIFIKDYKDFEKGLISKIINPKTNKALNDENRIKYIYDKCKQKLDIEDSQPQKSKSESPESEDNEIILDSYEKVKDILYIPFNTLAVNKFLIESLFTKPIEYNKGLLKLSKYLSSTNSHNIYVKSYNKTLDEINNIINSIYNTTTQANKNVLRQRHGWVENYMYNPLKTSELSQVTTNIPNTIVKTKKILIKMLKNSHYINKNDIKGSILNNRPIESELRDILFYSSKNKNKSDIIKNLEDNRERYLALQFILIIIKDELNNNTYVLDNKIYIKIHLDILDSLITKNVVNGLFNNNYNYSQSISNSISWSGTPRSSSSDHSHFQSNANIERYRISKANLVAEITQNNINDMDPYLAERWEDMPIEKLRNVISIKHTEGTNTYGVAFYIRTLYQAWRNSVKDNKPFKNPYTRKAFTDNDKEYILNSMKLLYPNIETPKIGDGRSDIIVETNNNDDEYEENMDYKFNYKLNLEKTTILIHLLTFSIPYNFNVEVEPAYIQQYLFENITYLIKNNKLFGKGMPLKIIPTLNEYIGRSIIFTSDEYDEYKIFFDNIKNAL